MRALALLLLPTVAAAGDLVLGDTVTMEHGKSQVVIVTVTNEGDEPRRAIVIAPDGTRYNVGVVAPRSSAAASIVTSQMVNKGRYRFRVEER